MSARARVPLPAQDVLLGLCRQEPEFERRYDVSTWQPLGEGRFGCVGRIHDRDLGRDVAVKVFWRVDPELRARVQAEVRNAQLVRGENVVDVHTVYFGRCAAWLEMELVDGDNLDTVFDLRARENATFRFDEALAWALDATDAVVLAHAAGVVHRDIKPSNLLLTRGPHPRLKLGDFGISKHHDAARLTGTGEFAGTPAYAAPEVFDGQPATAASDVFSLAVVVYRILANGAHPYGLRNDATPMDILRHHRLGRSLPIREANPAVPEGLAVVLDHALDRRPERRPDALALREALRQARASVGVAPRAGRRRRLRGPATVSTLAVVSLALTWQPHTKTVLPPRDGVTEEATPAAPTPAPSVEPSPAAAVPRIGAPPRTAGGVRPVSGPRRDVPPRTNPPVAAVVPATLPVATPAPAPPAARIETTTESAARRDASSTPPPAVPAAPEAVVPAEPPPTAGMGTLSLVIVPMGEVVLDGHSVGVVKSKVLTLEAGRHVLRILHPDYEPLPRVVTLEPGGRVHLQLDLSQKGIPRRASRTTETRR